MKTLKVFFVVCAVLLTFSPIYGETNTSLLDGVSQPRPHISIPQCWFKSFGLEPFNHQNHTKFHFQFPIFLSLYKQMLNIFLLGLLPAAITTFLATKFFPKLNLLDFPERYGLKRKALPYPGGIIFLTLCFGIALLDNDFLVLFPSLLGLGLLSFLDDRTPIPAGFRIIMHLIFAALVFFLGVKINFISNPFLETNFELSTLPIVSFLATIGWIVLVQNAMNFFDGVGGLSIGVSGIGFLTLGALGLVRPELFFDTTHLPLTQANFFLAGLCLGGFWWFWQKKIILGDTGSQVLGFLLAVMSIFSGAKIATTLLVLGVPVLDAIFVIFRRTILEKKPPWKGDLLHLHHHFVRAWGEKPTAIFLIFCSGMLGTMAVSLTGMEKLWGILAVVILVWGGCFWGWLSTKK